MMHDEWIEVTPQAAAAPATGAARTARIVRRKFTDLNAVEPHHAEIHRRLESWAASVRNRSGPAVSPGFEQAQSSWSRTPPDPIPRPVAAVDRDDAMKIARAIAEIPVRNAAALGWFYVNSTKPLQILRHLDVDFPGLYDLIYDGRQALIDAGV